MTMNFNYNPAKPQAVSSNLSLGKLEVVVIAVVFLQSLLIAWFLFLLVGAYDEGVPLFRLLQGIAILFAILVPVFILLEGFRYNSIMAGFFIPLALYALMFPLFNSLIYHLNLFLDPTVILPALVGGFGFGLIGLGAYHMRNGVSKTFALVTAGVTIIFLSSPMIFGIFLFVLTGNLTSFPSVFI
jgi:hypothetical protein